jgi:adenylate cyclase
MNAEVERRLTNILSADVYGYSRLMGLDEAGTLATLNAYRIVMVALIEQHRGRVVNAAGDHLLAEFGSPVMAVQCAVEIQRQLAERNAPLEADRQMWFRIGINLGDVIVERDDLFGDDVNIAARLQSLAEPGGILISGTVFDQVKNKLTLSFDALGPQRLKNIDVEVPAYRAVLGTDAAVATVPSKDAEAKHQADKRHRFKIAAIRTGALVALFLAINLFSYDGELWFQWPALAVLFVFAMRTTWIFRK